MDTRARRLLIRTEKDLTALLDSDPLSLTAHQVEQILGAACLLWQLVDQDPSPPECEACATPLADRPTGRIRRYCTDACRQQHARTSN